MLPENSFQSENIFAGCQQTALSDSFLAEIGRFTVHYASFVAQARELVRELNANNLVDWDVCTRDDLVQNLPAILGALKSKCSTEYKAWLTQCIVDVLSTIPVMDNLRLSTWGVSVDGGREVAVSTPISVLQPTVFDVQRHTRHELYKLAMQVTFATRQLAYLKQEITAMF